jgi:hypothetical protein
MSLLDLLRKLAGGGDASELHISKEESLSGLNLKSALDVHAAWNDRLKKAIQEGNSDAHNISDVAQDDLCVLGKWIHDPGKKLYGHLAEYDSLRNTHADFHMCCGDILLASQAGNSAKASNMLGKEFRQLSGRIQLDLVRLFTVAKK